MKQNRFGVFQPVAGVFVLFALWAGVCQSGATEVEETVADANPTRVLLESVFRLEIGSQVAQRADALAAGADAPGVAEVTAAIEAFRSAIGERLRAELGTTFGGSAREIFGGFVSDFSQAERDEKLDFLERIVSRSELWIDAPPKTYAALRTAMIEDVLTDDLGRAGAFLADLQTWLDLRERQNDVPSLRSWLDRGIVPEAVGIVSFSPPPREKRNSLRDAEAKADVYEGGDDDAGGALDQFGAARAERRRKALDDARAGMQQVAEERRTAEEEAASKTLAAAQAEAEAVRKHAEKLAAAEGEAIEQRRNSWGNRLKSVLTTTIGATSGAFLGNVGSRAGEAAAEAVFNTEGQHRHGGRHY